ncbi:hypothetical protein BDN72DRAFT_755757 [Pluteus cervinus]|uniref:Uncharacterized protein n=1 Tax=Pluteus cervinus TaxID=181527 RepID=A0ACD3BFZ9_9AGAR|nr:hypothetical protein BDN72DRAFT_755757 [Pluteus cervinus]
MFLSTLWRGCRLSALGLRRSHTAPLNVASSEDFKLWPAFISHTEQQLLLLTSLKLLDLKESKKLRNKRKLLSKASPSSLLDVFYPDEYYDFHEGHYDGVIHNYREMHLSSWPEAETPGLTPILERLRTLYPTSEPTQTHLLHLASNGEILPHVDNTSASGAWIMGVSLGAERTLRMQNVHDDRDNFSMTLPSGSVYLQKDAIRYQYVHSILSSLNAGQRLSIMIRVRKAISSIRITLTSVPSR